MLLFSTYLLHFLTTAQFFSVLSSNQAQASKQGKYWRYERWWHTLLDFTTHLYQRWRQYRPYNSPCNWQQNTQKLLRSLHYWSQSHNGNLRYRKLWDQLSAAETHNDVAAKDLLSKQLDSALKQNEIYWHQRLRINWLNYGDRNTTYFHKKATLRK